MLDILTIGTVTQDMFLCGIDRMQMQKIKERPYLCLPLGAKLGVEKIVSTYGGSALNTAISFKKQGLNVGLISLNCHGEDTTKIPHLLKQNKITNFLCKVNSLVQLPLSIILVNADGERTILNHKEDSYKWPKDIFATKMPESRVVVVGSLNGQKEIWQALFKQKKNQSFVLAANPGRGDLDIFKNNPKLLNKIDILMLNREEGAYLTGEKYLNWQKIFKTLDQLVTGIVVMTDGEKGAMVSNGQTVWEAAAINPETLIEKTGAGDAFLSGFVFGLYNPKNLSAFDKSTAGIENALRLGTVNAYNVVRFVGASTGLFPFKNLPQEIIEAVRIRTVDKI
ncbi:MAG TPA: carbohydrate kinase family protein [Candidatus Paceibacterota bacterium]|nr:carbohydrate kinase family protein [Candidatus Paceibacterota bacterium]